MKLTLKRDTFTATTTIGRLYVDGKFECYTLEDVVRPNGVKVYGETAIPEGTYEVIITLSQRFGKLMPLLKDVPMFEGIRIHPGNTNKDTHGCILVGLVKAHEKILSSRSAYDALFQKLAAALGKGEPVTIEVGRG